jgi:hypothetical protein
MTTLNLLFEPIKTSFTPKKLNLLFVFQMNCPDCFIYGIPLVNEVFQKYNDSEFGILGLSTACEDFDLNTLENTLLLLEQNNLVGVTKEQLGADYQFPILFPVVMDKKLSPEEAILEENVEKMCQINPNYPQWSIEEKQQVQNRVKEYLMSLPTISYTFTINQFPGTPTFILFDQALNILAGWFGDQNLHSLESEINNHKTK